ncbi:MAG: ABC transporter permease [Cyclobacteriaceae bacterium]|nr:ABC transporter permease [Cyclobacteriaceae bacterium]
MMTIVYSIQSEWLKRKGSLASWLVIIGAFFSPTLFTFIQIFRPEKLPERYASADFWEGFYRNAWQPMNMLLLPMGIILAISLLTQLEYKNNAWKQVHTSPQSLATIFFAKFAVVIAMEIELFLLFNVAVYLSALIPSLVLGSVSYPTQTFPWMFVVNQSAVYFVESLPIVAIQFLLALRFRNFLVPVGAGIILLMVSILLISWEYIYVYPYGYASLTMLNRFPDINLPTWAAGWFAVIMVAAFALYVTKNDKG